MFSLLAIADFFRHLMANWRKREREREKKKKNPQAGLNQAFSELWLEKRKRKKTNLFVCLQMGGQPNLSEGALAKDLLKAKVTHAVGREREGERF